MKEKYVSNILFFSLLTLVVCSNLKAMDDSISPDPGPGSVQDSNLEGSGPGLNKLQRMARRVMMDSSSRDATF